MTSFGYIQFTIEQCSLQLLECETNDKINDVIQSEEGAIVSHIGWPTGKKFNVSIHVMIKYHKMVAIKT